MAGAIAGERMDMDMCMVMCMLMYMCMCMRMCMWCNVPCVRMDVVHDGELM